MSCSCDDLLRQLAGVSYERDVAWAIAARMATEADELDRRNVQAAVIITLLRALLEDPR